MSTDLFNKDFVPVPHMGLKGSPSFHKYSSALPSAAQESLPLGHNFYLSNSPAHLSSPFSSSEVAYTTAFVPIDVKSDQHSKDSSAYDNHPDYDQHELSAETSSLDGAHFAEADERDAARKNKKKVGRPIAYKGDPNASNLTEAERRRIKRRIANRESARRVRARRQETLEELQVRMNHINAHNSEMVKHIADVEGHTALLKGQLQQTEMHWNRAVDDNARLHQQMAVLSAKLKDQPTLENVDQACAQKAPVNAATMARAGSYNAAPGTGISCALIDELPTMALPMTEMVTGPGWEGFDQEFSDYLM